MYRQRNSRSGMEKEEMNVKVMKGLPASGKSTRSKQLVRDAGNYGRVNRDDLRAMIFDSVWSGPREKVIVECEKAIAAILLKNKMHVVVDDTNLLQKQEDLWKNFCASNNATFDLEDIGCNIQTCIDRDAQREKRVGEAIIYRMALDAGLIPFDERKIVIVDIDGTIADGSHREYLVNGDKKDWPQYFNLMCFDAPIQHVIDWVNDLSKDHMICVVTGRPDEWQYETLRWLREKAKVHFDYLFMRRGSDKRPDVDVKTDILNLLPKDQVFMAIDDRPAVINGCWRKNGILVIPVRGECEDF